MNLRNLTDSEAGDVLYFHYTPENNKPGYRLARVDEVGNYYIQAYDLKKNEPRRFNDHNAAEIEVIGQKNDRVKTRDEVLATLETDGIVLPHDYPGPKLCNFILSHHDDISSAKYHKASESIILTYKEKPKSQPRLEVEILKTGYHLRFINESNINIEFKYDDETKKYGLTSSVGLEVKNPNVRDFIYELNNLFGI